MAGCSDSGSNKGTPVAKINWNQDGVTFVDVYGNRIIDTKDFSSAGEFSEGLCRVTDKASGLVGFIDINGKLVVPCRFPANPISGTIANGIYNIRENEMFHCGYARVGSKNNNVLIDKKGNPILEGYTAIDWDGKVAIVYKDRPHQQGVYTMDGQEVVPIGECEYKFIGEDMLACYSHQFYNWGIMDTRGQMITDNMEEMFANDYPFDEVGLFCDGRVFVKMDQGRTFCLLNKDGSVEQSFGKSLPHLPVTHCNYYVDAKSIYNSRYEKVAELPSGFYFSTVIPDESMMLGVHEKNNYHNSGFANVKGEIVIPCQYSEFVGFSDGMAFIKDDKGWHIIDDGGAICGSLQDKNLSPYAIGRFCANRAIIHGNVVVDKSGAVVDIPGMEKISGYHYSGKDNSDLGDEI
ncbi:MAG: hypothetical protein AUK63_1550 [bacterium P3]|nr:MAG: hypothetical protein AUK63_1550 [bacterium P3]KWW41054.1 MAG: hypothetical protein F083_1221 [bacterium F083]